MRTIKVNVIDDFFMNIKRRVRTSKPLEDVVYPKDLLYTIGVKVFGEESYYDLIEDLYYGYDDPEDAWPDGLLPRYPPKNEELIDIYEKRRKQIEMYNKQIEELKKNGYEEVKLIYTNEPQKYEYENPYATWTYDICQYKELIVLAKLRK